MLDQWMKCPRGRFTEADFDFVATALASDESRPHLEKLWKDPEGLRELLDLKEVFRNLIDSPFALSVSPRFYFYVLVRHAFVRADLTDVMMADYVAGVMAKRVCSSGSDPLQDTTRGFTHAAEFLTFISNSRGRMRYHLQVAAGNQFLILTGLYPEFLTHRNQRGEAPDLEFYETFARQAYRGAADSRLSPDASSRRVLESLSDSMPVARRSLNRLAEELVFLGD